MQKENSKVALLLCGGDINFSDLPIITNRSNAMIPVNGRPVIGWILEDLLAKKVNEVILVLRFDNFKLFNYVEWAFAKRMTLHYAFVQSGGSILHSLLAGLAWVRPDCGVHVILGDTLLQDAYPEKPDFVFAGTYENPEDWCLVRTDKHGHALEYFDKMEIRDDSLRALAGVYSLSDTFLLRNLVMDKIRRGSKEISHVLEEYGRVRAITVVEATAWYDFGHINYFNLAKRKLLQSRYFNSLTIDPIRGTITKRSENKEKLLDELAWYSGLPAHLKLLSPRIVQDGVEDSSAITQEYYGYPNLAELYVFGDIGLSVWMNALKKLMEIHFLLREEKGRIDPDDIIEMYCQKTKLRLKELQHQDFWKEISDRDVLVINGVSYMNFSSLEKKVENLVKQMSSRFEGCIIHGDYCFSNILYDLNSQLVRLIDPRGSFGRKKMYGDPRYDVAKLRHSVSGRYDFILADLFWVTEESKQFTLELFKPENYDSVCRFFDGLIVGYGYDKKEIMCIEGLLFVSMVPLHQDNFKRQLAMYLNGIIILNQVFNNADSN